MKVLFIGSGCACRLPFAESIFKKKLLEADVTGVEVETADVAEKLLLGKSWMKLILSL